MKFTTVIVLIIAMTLFSGCASYLSYQSSQEEIARERVIASGNKDAMDAVKMGVPANQALKAVPIPGGAGIAIDVTNLDALKKHPWRQLGAALLDLGLMYGTYEGVRYLNDESKDDDDDKSSIRVTGDGNEVNVTTVNGDGNNGNADHEDDHSTNND